MKRRRPCGWRPSTSILHINTINLLLAKRQKRRTHWKQVSVFEADHSGKVTLYVVNVKARYIIFGMIIALESPLRSLMNFASHALALLSQLPWIKNTHMGQHVWRLEGKEKQIVCCLVGGRGSVLITTCNAYLGSLDMFQIALDCMAFLDQIANEGLDYMNWTNPPPVGDLSRFILAPPLRNIVVSC